VGRKKFWGALVLIVATALPGPAWSAGKHDLEKRINDMEKRQAELYHSLKEKKTEGLMEKVSDKLSLGGIVEVEAAIDNNDNGDTSDIALATVELGLDAEINDRVSGHILMLYEDGGDFTIDEGTITITAPYGAAFTGGKMYVPFGSFNSHFISDSQTLELGETNKSALLLSYGAEKFEVSFGIFNGNVDEAGDNSIDDYFASITASVSEGISFGVSYISDIAETGSDVTGIAAGGATISDVVAGYSAFVSAGVGNFMIELEYLAAADSFKVADLDVDGDGKGDQPETFNVEVALQLNNALEVAAKYEGNDDFTAFPETQYGVAASYGLYENTSVAVEYLHGEYKGNMKRDLVTAQVAVEF